MRLRVIDTPIMVASVNRGGTVLKNYSVNRSEPFHASVNRLLEPPTTIYAPTYCKCTLTEWLIWIEANLCCITHYMYVHSIQQHWQDVVLSSLASNEFCICAQMQWMKQVINSRAGYTWDEANSIIYSSSISNICKLCTQCHKGMHLNNRNSLAWCTLWYRVSFICLTKSALCEMCMLVTKYTETNAVWLSGNEHK